MQSLNEKLTSITASFEFIIPELILVTGILILLLAGLFNNRLNTVFIVFTIIIAMASAAFIIKGDMEINVVLFNGMMQREGFGGFFMLLVDLGVILTCLMSLRHSSENHQSEYYALLLTVALGGHLLLMTTHLIVIFLSVELISISSYVLAGYSFDRRGSEGTLKYFLFGSISAAVMLYGFSLLFGLTGTLDFTSPEFISAVAENDSPLLLIAGLMSMAGFLFKIAAAPMHAWAPDVYEAAPVRIVAFLSTVPKLAGLGILTKFFMGLFLFGEAGIDWQTILAAVAILTITAGNFTALWQKDAKRMMAYSSIAQSGFLLVGVVALLPQGIHFMMFYAALYLLMNFTVFLGIACFEGTGLWRMEDYAGAGRYAPLAAVCLTIALVSLTGLPPTGGFTAKFLVFSALWESYETTRKALLLWLLIFGLLNTVVSLFYYLRIPYFAFVKAAGTRTDVQKMRGVENYLALILVVVIVTMFFLPGLLMGWINKINFVL